MSRPLDPREMDLASASWWGRFEQAITQEPLLHTRDTLAAQAERSLMPPPSLVMVGVGVCGQAGVTQGVPLDLLGLLAPAEALRRTVGASQLVALIADRHAEAVGWDSPSVERAARQVERALQNLRRAAGWEALRPLRASALHRRPVYQQVRERLAARCRDLPVYAQLQLADVESLRESAGSLLKVGWTLGGDGRDAPLDERWFDAVYLERVGAPVRFAYTLPGRTLDPERPRASPYVALRRDRRLLLDDELTPAAKLRRAPEAAQRSVRRHLSLLTRSAKEHVLEVEGAPEERARQLQLAAHAPPPPAATDAVGEARDALQS